MHHNVIYKLLALLLVLVLVFSLASCKHKKGKDVEQDDPASETEEKKNGETGGGIEGPIIDLEPTK